MLPSPLLLFLLLCAGTSPGVHAETMDLYVREVFADVNGGPCDSCREGDGCYLRSRSFYLQRTCFNRGDTKSSRYDEVEDGIICRQDLRTPCEDREDAAGDDGMFDAATADDCRDTWAMDECAGFERMRKLGGWCAPAAAAGGQHTVPLLAFRLYDDVASCGSADYRQLLMPDERGACVAMSYPGYDGALVAGSRQGACVDDAFAAARYATADCTGPAEQTVLDGSSTACLAAMQGPVATTEDCAAPRVLCRPSPLFGDGAASAVDSAKGAVAEGGGGGATAREAGEAGSIVGMVAGAIAVVAVLGAGFLAIRKRRRVAQGDGGAPDKRPSAHQDQDQDQDPMASAIPAEVRMISGCQDQQTSADANIQNFSLPDPAGRKGGVCTAALLQVLYEYDSEAPQDDAGKSWVDVLRAMRSNIAAKGYEQIPQLSSSRMIEVNNPVQLVNADGGTRRAVLIGINYVGHNPGELSGCHNDVKNITNYLTDSLGFAEKNMRVLMDDGEHDKPTAANIFKAMDWIVRKSRPGDTVWFHYSGHGARLRDQVFNGDEEDGYDETLCPLDYKTAGQIRDDDLLRRLIKPMPQGVLMTCVMDACHSGTVLDLPYNFIGDGKHESMEPNEGFNLDTVMGAGGASSMLPTMNCCVIS